MASEANIVKRRAEALKSIEISVSNLADNAKIEIETKTLSTANAEYNVLLRLEKIASNLTAILDAKEEKPKTKK